MREVKKRKEILKCLKGRSNRYLSIVQLFSYTLLYVRSLEKIIMHECLQKVVLEVYLIKKPKNRNPWRLHFEFSSIFTKPW